MKESNKSTDISEFKKQFAIDPDILAPFSDFDIVRITGEEARRENRSLATEVPFTITANDIEVVTLLALPLDLKELTAGFLNSSGFIVSIDDILSYSLDTAKWKAECELARTPDVEIMRKRLYTSGCGKGVMYGNIDELSSRHPIASSLKIPKESILELSHWLQKTSALYKITGGVHTAAISFEGKTPEIVMDDIGRHNAVDKVIGRGMIDRIDFTKSVLITSGRTSSEILQKARKANIAVLISRGAPTHQTVLRAKEMGITIVGFARGSGFNIFSHEDRIVY